MKVLKFGAVWCSSCLVMRPRWQKIEKHHKWLKTKYYDFDNDKQMVKKYNIQSEKLPTFVFLDKKNRELFRLSGEISEEKIQKVVLENKDK